MNVSVPCRALFFICCNSLATTKTAYPGPTFDAFVSACEIGDPPPSLSLATLCLPFFDLQNNLASPAMSHVMVPRLPRQVLDDIGYEMENKYMQISVRGLLDGFHKWGCKASLVAARTGCVKLAYWLGELPAEITSGRPSGLFDALIFLSIAAVSLVIIYN